MPNPPPPIIPSEPHRCKVGGYLCEQERNGYLGLIVTTKVLGQTSVHSIRVNFCPFCGFKGKQ